MLKKSLFTACCVAIVLSLTQSGSAEDLMHLKVDLALARYGSDQPWEGTLKPGWISWAQPRWHDMYGHDCVLANGTGEEASCCDDFTGKPGLGGSGVMASMSCVYEGRGGLIAAGLEMCNLNATCGPPAVSGEVLYDPICNTWFQITDFGNVPGSFVMLGLYNIPAGEYTLTTYHNKFGGGRNGGNPHWECVCDPQPPMTAIYVVPAMSAETLFEEYGQNYEWPKWKCQSYDLGSEKGVELIQAAYEVEIQQVTSDDDLVPSEVKFRTDGSAVMVVYEGNCCQYVPDDIRSQRESQRAIVNAFELKMETPTPTATLPNPGNNLREVPTDSVLKWLAGGYAVEHDLYLGTDYNAVAGASNPDVLPGRGRLNSNTYDPGLLALGTTYYWRIDEVNETNPESPWRGDMWTFTTKACLDMEDFESYGGNSDLLGEWEMGNGAWLELATDNAHGGSKSALLTYYNKSGFKYSELVHTLDEPQDWAAANVEAIGLFFSGAAGNGSDDIYVALTDAAGKTAAATYGGSPEDIGKPEWQPMAVYLQDFTGVNLNAVAKIAVGVGSRIGGSVSGTAGTVYIDDIALCVPSCIDEIAVPGDLVHNCRVDFKDFSVIAAEWLDKENLQADITGDGKTNFRDLRVLTENWLHEELWP